MLGGVLRCSPRSKSAGSDSLDVSHDFVFMAVAEKGSGT